MMHPEKYKIMIILYFFQRIFRISNSSVFYLFCARASVYTCCALCCATELLTRGSSSALHARRRPLYIFLWSRTSHMGWGNPHGAHKSHGSLLFPYSIHASKVGVWRYKRHYTIGGIAIYHLLDVRVFVWRTLISGMFDQPSCPYLTSNWKCLSANFCFFSEA